MAMLSHKGNGESSAAHQRAKNDFALLHAFAKSKGQPCFSERFRESPRDFWELIVISQRSPFRMPYDTLRAICPSAQGFGRIIQREGSFTDIRRTKRPHSVLTTFPKNAFVDFPEWAITRRRRQKRPRLTVKTQQRTDEGKRSGEVPLFYP